ncbi:hypothetical protein NDU88_001946 [Pleurodeles waltl]|uniref:Uncharacterized protein n=1 Tax=Pleurodeles waltl TaxID=8319 RepID=A0AAV7SB96_PLEWA|nr:hypothetical protein NDU88_001946 [Pleurodeles waltl]
MNENGTSSNKCLEHWEWLDASERKHFHWSRRVLSWKMGGLFKVSDKTCAWSISRTLLAERLTLFWEFKIAV